MYVKPGQGHRHEPICLLNRKRRRMLKDFADWLRDAGIEPNEDSPKHRAAIEAYEPEAKEVISFARFFYGLSIQESSLDKFGTALEDAGPSFSMRDHKRQLAVFAGAELAAVI